MPRREPIKRERTEYGYEELLAHMRTIINEQHGGVAKFVESPEFRKCGFADTPAEKRNFHTYMAVQSDKSKTVKSVPVLKKLYKGLLDIELDSKIVVVRTQVILSDAAIF